MTARLILHLRHVDLPVPHHAEQPDSSAVTWGVNAAAPLHPRRRAK